MEGGPAVHCPHGMGPGSRAELRCRLNRTASIVIRMEVLGGASFCNVHSVQDTNQNYSNENQETCTALEKATSRLCGGREEPRDEQGLWK